MALEPTHALRMGLVMLLADEDYPVSDGDRAFLVARLADKSWADDVREGLKAWVIAWVESRQNNATIAVRRALGEEIPQDVIPPKQIDPASVWLAGSTPTATPSVERSPDMIATTDEQYTQENVMDGIDDEKLTQVIQKMQAPPYWFPESPGRLARAVKLYREGKVTEHFGTYRVVGTDETYDIDTACTCKDSQRSKSKWCAHLIATVLYRKMHAAFTNEEPPLFPPTPTVEERMAQSVEPDEDQINFTTGEITDEETPVSDTTDEFYPETAIEAPSSSIELARPAQVLRLAPRPIHAIIADLSRPLPPECIDTLSRGGTRIQFLHWHTVAAVLDAYATGWQGAVVRVDKIGEKCSVTYRITIPAAEGLCSREDSGMEDEDKDDYGDAMTNATATAFKRAAAKFGLGRWLYDTKEHTTKFAAKLRGEREELLKALADAADQAGIPRAKVIDWLKRETGCHRNVDIPAWALRDALTQLQSMAQSAA